MISALPKEKTQLINTSQHNHHSLFRVVNVSWQHWHHGSSCSRDLNIMQPSSTHPRPRWSVNVFVALVTWSNGLTYYLVHFLKLDWWIHSHKSCQRFYPCPLMESHPRYDISWLASLECFGVVACELGEEKKSSKSGSSCHASLTLFASSYFCWSIWWMNHELVQSMGRCTDCF